MEPLHVQATDEAQGLDDSGELLACPFQCHDEEADAFSVGADHLVAPHAKGGSIPEELDEMFWGGGGDVLPDVGEKLPPAAMITGPPSDEGL